MKKIVSFLFVLVLSVSAYAEAMSCVGGYCFDCYDSSLGLPQNQVVAFSKNACGFMFVAGRNTISRFDGNEFVLPKGGRLEDLPTNTINDFVSDDAGTGYVATDLGLWTVDLNRIDAFAFNIVDKLDDVSVKTLAYDRKKALLYGAVSGKGVFALSAKGFFEWFNPENSRLVAKNVNKIFADSLGTVWLGTENGVYFMKDGSERFIQVDYLDDSVSAFTEDDENRIYAGGGKGYYLIENGEVSISYAGEKVPWRDTTVLETADSGRLWIGTKNSGLFYDEIASWPVDGAVSASIRDSEGEVWFGTSAGGFCIVKESAFKDTIFGDESVSGIVSDASGNILVNTKSGIVGLGERGEKKVVSNSVFDTVFFDKTDNLWASSKSSGLFIMQPDKSFKPVREIYTSEDDLFPVSSDVFFSDADGNVWVNDISMKGAMFMFRNDRTAERFMLPDADAEIVGIIGHGGKIFIVTKRSGVFSLEENNTIDHVDFWKKEIFVKRVFVDSKQRIWIITLSDDIFIDIEGDAVAFPIAGISGRAAIHSISEDKNGNLWIMTNAGVVAIKGTDATCFMSGRCADVPIIVYGKKDGMNSVECAEGRTSDAAVSADGFLFVPMMKGVAVFNTDFKENSGFVPEITIDRIVDDSGKNYVSDETDEINMPGSVKNLKISYSAPLFSGGGALLFDYSFDKEHVRGTTEKTLDFSDVPSGLHEFSVIAYRSGDPSKFSEKRLVFKVKPKFYEEKWFVVTSPILAVLLIVIVIFLNRRRKAVRKAEIKRLIDEKTAELQIKNNALKEAVMKDPLTGLMNRRYMFDVEERKIRRFIESRDRKIHLLDNRNMFEKNDIVYGVIMMDIDHFKRVNDLYGHDAGDMVLKGVAEVMQESVRADDILIRWGGEEFLIVLKNIPLNKMIEVVKKIRKAIEKRSFTTQGGTTIWITVSMGVVFLPFFASEPKLLTFENIITLADMALYHSKDSGRDMATFVVPGEKVPETPEDISSMLTSSEFAVVNGFYTFEKIEPDNFSEFEI
ncbi:diguanylate cyclase [bacterium]|nr:diguanylate cyclase [bacterium]